jgi:hypothetical protein
MVVELFTVNRKLVLEAIDHCLCAVVNAVRYCFCGRLGRVKVTLAAAVLSLIVSFPAYKVFNFLLNHYATIQALSVKFHNPLSPIPPELKDLRIYDDEASHNDKLELRLTLPVLGWLSHTGKWTVVIWSPLSALGVFYLLAKLGSEALDDEVGGALFVLALAPTFFGSYFFNDIDAGDGVAFLFLLLSIASRSPVLTSASFFAAAFDDERCVTAVPLLLLYFAVSLGRDTERIRRHRQYLAILFGVAAWLLVRWWVARTYHLGMGTSMLGAIWIIRQNLVQRIPYVFFDIFRTAWTIPLVAVICLWLRRRWSAWLAYVGAFAIAFAPALLVLDFDRSVCYTFTILLTSLYSFRGGENKLARKYLAAVLVANLLFISPGTSILRVAGWWLPAR